MRSPQSCDSQGDNGLASVYDALEKTYATEVPLAAVALLTRWSRLLARPCPIAPGDSRLMRKSGILASIHRSATFKAELLQALELTQHREAASWRAHMYSILLPSLPPAEAAVESCSDRKRRRRSLDLGSGSGSVPFSASRTYKRTREFYAGAGFEAWTREVPCGVTTNAFIAAAYARTVQAYAADVLRQARDGAGTVHVFELASGPAQFAYLFCTAFQELRERGRQQDAAVRLRYYVTDFNRALLLERSKLPWLQPLIRAGVMDFAVLDAAAVEDDEAGLQLLCSGGLVEAGSLQGPVVVIGNYALDTLPCDCFFRLPDGEVSEVEADAATGQLQLRAWSVDELRACHPDYRAVLGPLLARGPGLHVVPVGFMSALRRVKSLIATPPAGEPPDVALLVGDGTFQYDDEHWCRELRPGGSQGEGLPPPHTPSTTSGAFIPLPDMSPSPRCFAMAVDFEALALAMASVLLPDTDGQLPSLSAQRSTSVDGSLTVAWLVTHSRQRSPSSSLVAFGEGLCLQQPSDFELIHGLAEEGVCDQDECGRAFLSCLDGRGLLDLLRWSCFDYDLFSTVRWLVRDHIVGRSAANEALEGAEHLESATGTAASDVREAVEVGLRCWRHRVALTPMGWRALRWRMLQWLYCMGAYLDLPSLLLADAALVEGREAPGNRQEEEELLKSFNGYTSAAEAYVVGRAMERAGRADLACHVYHAASQVAFADPQGVARVKGRVKRQQAGAAQSSHEDVQAGGRPPF